MKSRFKATTAALALGMFLFSGVANAADSCKVAWSHYVGWEPFGWLQDTGVAKKWGAKYNVDLSFKLINDYMESVNQYTAGTFDGIAVTNMDALATPAVGGVDTTVIAVGDFSNGNDGILINSPSRLTVKDLAGKKIKLVELSVSHYLLARALQANGLSEKNVTVVNTSDADLGSLIATSKQNDAFVTWNPILLKGRGVKGIQMVFDSSKIPGEIIDTMMVHSNVSENCKKAATGAWYEAMQLLNSTGPEHDKMLEFLAAQSGGTKAEFDAQLRTTKLFFAPADAAKFAESPDIKKTMEFVAKFSFDHGLYGEHAKDEKFVGIQYSDGTVWGNPNFVRLRFSSTYMNMAAQGKL